MMTAMQNPTDGTHLVALCTCPPDKAASIARELVRRRLCACVNIVPGLLSVYAWKGAVEEDNESLLLIKTRDDRLAALESAIREIHPYEIFELIACRIENGHEPYLHWIDESVLPPA